MGNETQQKDESLDSSGLEKLFPAERAKAFIDAVVAIAMTLLILPLMEAASEITNSEGDLAHWFEEHSGQTTAFILSFTIIGFFWIGHHRVFSKVETITNRLLWLNLLWLLTIVWLPVVTALTGRAQSNNKVVLLTYIGSMLVASLVWLIIKVYLAFHPSLHRMSGESVRVGVIHSTTIVALFAVIMVIAAVFPSIGYGGFVVAVLSGVMRRIVTPLFRKYHPVDGTAEA